MPFKSSLKFSFLVFFFISLTALAQKGIVNGVLTDETGPLPGVSIIIKGMATGTETDFDGKYSIACKVGDVLVFSFIGMASRELKVTPALFGDQSFTPTIPTEAVNKILSDDYNKALKNAIDSISLAPELSKDGLTYNKTNYHFDSQRIKHIKESKGKIKLSYFNPDILYQIKYNSSISLQFVDKNKLPKLQDIFAQGSPFNGENQWFGPETNEIFSFGPNVNSITFDGSNYSYDTNGRLIAGVGQNQILPYDNSIFQSAVILSNNLNLKISNNTHSLALNLRRKTQEDLFNTEKSNLNQLHLNYDYKNSLAVFVKSNTTTSNQPNTNGFLNNLIASSYITPNSFQNNQGYSLSDNAQRSFSPTQFNNPIWLVQTNQNKSKSTSTIFGSRFKMNLGDNTEFKTMLSYTFEKDQLNFALPKNTVGFENGYTSKKNFDENTFHAYVGLDHHFDMDAFLRVEFNSSIKYKRTNLKYNLIEQNGFSGFGFQNPINESSGKRQFNNNAFRFGNDLKFDLDVDFAANISLTNNTVSSTFQGNEYLLPSAQFYIELQNLLQTYNWMNVFSITAGIAKEAKDMPIFYTNQSHNSLLISPQQAHSFTANHDLFNNKTLSYETAINFDAASKIILFGNRVNIGINYYHSKSKNGIFPILTNGGFELKNIANIQNQGWEANLGLRIGNYSDDFHYQPKFHFSKNKGKVIGLLGDNSAVPIAGFSTVSNSMILGEPTGTIVGSAFLRDNNGSIIIDAEGYPIVANENKIIGNTTPDYNLSMENNFSLGKFRLNFLIDYQKGGDVWNGTKNVLNYSGRSQESADLRDMSNFIFDGVDQFGNTNIIPVDFANANQDVTQNRWVRFGYSGVDEEAIVDGTFINLKSLSVTYDFANRNQNSFFRQLELSIYAYNLISFAKTRGISPYSSLFDHSSAKGLDYFNMPLVKELGFKINIKL